MGVAVLTLAPGGGAAATIAGLSNTPVSKVASNLRIFLNPPVSFLRSGLRGAARTSLKRLAAQHYNHVKPSCLNRDLVKIYKYTSTVTAAAFAPTLRKSAGMFLNRLLVWAVSAATLRPVVFRNR